MKVSHFGIRLAAVAILAWPLLDSAALAQRGDRGGNDRGGARSGDRGGSGRSYSGGGRQGQPNARRSPGGGQRGTRDTSRSRSDFQQRSPDRNRTDAQRSRSGDAQRRDSGPQQRQSFYRGGDSDRSQRQQFDRSRSDRDRQADRPDDRRDSRDFRDARDRQFDADRDRQARNRQDWRDDRDDSRRTADRIRRDWNRNWDRGYVPFRTGLWDNYGAVGWPVYSPWRYSRWQNQPNFWWGSTPATALTDWFVFGGRPMFWSYGPGGNYYYRDNYVYYNNQRYMPVDDYYDSIRDQARNVPQIDPQEAERMDWAPLGVFAATRENETASHRVLQLTANREGVITGTYFNQEQERVRPILGRVDEQSQRAAWTFADGEQDHIVFETSIYNLTRPESDMMVHFGPSANQTEVWQLVRLEQPDVSASAPTGGPNSRDVP
jgi:hypothetical protein